MFSKSSVIIFSVLFSVVQVLGHGHPNPYTGENQLTSQPIGFEADIKQCGLPVKGCEGSTPIIRDNDISKGGSGCGKTENQGNLDIAAEVAAQGGVTNLASVPASGSMIVPMFLLNEDGDGPYTADLDTTGSGTAFTPVTVTQNINGFLGFGTSFQQTSQLTVQMPPNTQCNPMCLLRVRNNTPAGPFGGCIPMQGSGGSGSNTTATADKRASEPPNVHKKRMVRIRNEKRRLDEFA